MKTIIIVYNSLFSSHPSTSSFLVMKQLFLLTPKWGVFGPSAGRSESVASPSVGHFPPDTSWLSLRSNEYRRCSSSLPSPKHTLVDRHRLTSLSSQKIRSSLLIHISSASYKSKHGITANLEQFVSVSVFGRDILL